MEIKIKRIYEKPAKSDGTRILIDRIWPRGVKRIDAAIDDWMKEIAPSESLRKWFDHKEERFAEFEKKYIIELENNAGAVQQLLGKAKENRLTLLYGAKDQIHNQAAVLKTYLLNQQLQHTKTYE